MCNETEGLYAKSRYHWNLAEVSSYQLVLISIKLIGTKPTTSLIVSTNDIFALCCAMCAIFTLKIEDLECVKLDL